MVTKLNLGAGGTHDLIFLPVGCLSLYVLDLQDDVRFALLFH